MKHAARRRRRLLLHAKIIPLFVCFINELLRCCLYCSHHFAPYMHISPPIIIPIQLIVSSLSLSSIRSSYHFKEDMGILGAIARGLDALIGPGVMLLYPLYASTRAIESPSTLDDQQWLTYWILYSFITLFELSSYKILAWLPFWPYLKLVFCMWLVLPIFNGAAYIYENFAHKYVKMGEIMYINSNYPEGQKKVLQMMSLDARKSVERYIEKYGPDAFDRVVRAAEKEAKKH